MLNFQAFALGIAIPMVFLPAIQALLKEIKLTNYELTTTCILRIGMCRMSKQGGYFDSYGFFEVNDIRFYGFSCETIEEDLGVFSGKGYTLSAYVTPDCKHYELLSRYETEYYTNLTYVYELVPHGAYFFFMTTLGGYELMQDFYNQTNHKFFSNFYETFGLMKSLNSYHSYNRLIPNREPVDSLVRMDGKCRDTPEGMQVYNDQLDHSASGAPCIAPTTSANRHPFTMYTFQQRVNFSLNYCRNPTEDPNGPWCFVQDQETPEYCDIDYCDGWRDSFGVITRKGYQYENVASLKIHETSYKNQSERNRWELRDRIEDKVVYYYFPVEKQFCLTPLVLLDRTTIDPRHYGLDDRSEIKDVDFGNRKLHVMVSEPIACSRPLVGWEFIAANPGDVYASLFRRADANFQLGYKRLGYTQLTITEDMISDDNEIQYMCVRDNPVAYAKSGDYYGFYTDSSTSTLPPFKRLYVQERSNFKTPCSRQMISTESGTAHILDADASSFNADDEFLFTTLKRISMGLALKPILDPEFQYKCMCTENVDCSLYGDKHLLCVSGSCQCEEDYAYNRKINKCIFSKVAFNGSVYQSSTSNEFPTAIAANAVDDSSMSTFSFTRQENNPWWLIDMGTIHTLLAFRIRTPPMSSDVNYAELWARQTDYDAGKIPDTILFEDSYDNIPSLTGESTVQVIVTHGTYTWIFESSDESSSLRVNEAQAPGRHFVLSDNGNFGDLATNDVVKASRIGNDSDLTFLYTYKNLRWGGTDHPLEEFEFGTFDVNQDDVHYYRKQSIFPQGTSKDQCIEILGAKQQSSDVAVTLLAKDDLDPNQYWFTLTDRDGTYTTSGSSGVLLRISDYGIHNFTVALSNKIDLFDNNIAKQFPKKCTHVIGGPEPGRDFWMDCDTPVSGRYVAFYMSNDNPDESIKLTDVQLFTLPGCYGDDAKDIKNKIICSDVIQDCEMCELDEEDVCSFHCTCETGYTLDEDGKTCVDIDECSLIGINCYPHCVNTPGSFRCDCGVGYMRANDGTTCVDIDECSLQRSECSTCENTIGSFKCTCSSGFQAADYDADQCIDIDECATSNGGCSHECRNTFGSFSCSCSHGYTLSTSLYCDDEDECETDNGGCGGICVNSIGSFRCDCDDGYVFSSMDPKLCQDINECSYKNGGCEHTCVNYPGSYECFCDESYRLIGKHYCTKTNEAQLRTTLLMPYDRQYSDTSSPMYLNLVQQIEANLNTSICNYVKVVPVTCEVIGPLQPQLVSSGNQNVMFDFVAKAEEVLSTSVLAQLIDELKVAFQNNTEGFDINGQKVNTSLRMQFLVGKNEQWELDSVCDLYNNMDHCKRGKCMIVDGEPTCVCPTGYKGERCELKSREVTRESLAGFNLGDKDLTKKSAIGGFVALTLAWIFQFTLMCMIIKGARKKRRNKKNKS